MSALEPNWQAVEEAKEEVRSKLQKLAEGFGVSEPVEQDPPEVRAIDIIVDAMDDIEARMNVLHMDELESARVYSEAMKTLTEAYVMVKEANK